MAENEQESGCVAPAKGPLQSTRESTESHTSNQKEKTKMKPLVGNPAPAFEASGYFEGGFKNFKLSDFKGKWILLCFYPGDFTFV